jgi:hypothetical protein
VKIGFFHVDNGSKEAKENYDCARALVHSARDVMPDIPIVQFTDMATKEVKHVTEVRRKPSEPMALLRMRHHACVRSNWLFVDTDVIFQQDIRGTFKLTFEIGLTSRAWNHVKAAVGFSERMPFNTGVVFSKRPHFWQEVYCRLRNYPSEEQQWMGDQAVIGEMFLEDSGRYDFRVLSGTRLNFPPLVEDPAKQYAQQLKDAHIVHYKGPERKKLLLERIRRERLCA